MVASPASLTTLRRSFIKAIIPNARVASPHAQPALPLRTPGGRSIPLNPDLLWAACVADLPRSTLRRVACQPGFELLADQCPAVLVTVEGIGWQLGVMNGHQGLLVAVRCERDGHNAIGGRLPVRAAPGETEPP